MNIPLLEVQQPIGSFYLSVLPADFIITHTKRRQREYDNERQSAFGIQRRLDERRVRDVEAYTSDPEATFPTPIIISISRNDFEYTIGNGFLEFDDDDFIAEIVDGQHRLEGLSRSACSSQFSLPIVVLFDLTEQEKAYIFSTVNSNQQKVSPSLIYDLFAVSEGRSPFKTAHDMARALNTDEKSPYLGRLKMLGRKSREGETLSQGTFVNSLLPLISRDPKRDLIDEKNHVKLVDDPMVPFRYSYINNEDQFIYRVLLNYFTAISSVFNDEWNTPNQYIISKSTGCGGMMYALCRIALRGIEARDLRYEYFHRIAQKSRDILEKKNMRLTSEFFPSNNDGQAKLSLILISAL
jgi:hypothetical protein